MPSPRSIFRKAVPGLLILGLIVEAWFPFGFEVPIRARRGPAVDQDGTRLFDGHSALISSSAQAWVAAAVDNQELHVRIEARTTDVNQDGPARILTVSRNVYDSALLVGQQGDDLVMELRHPNSDGLGNPPLTVSGAFSDEHWHAIALDIDSRSVQLTLDGVLVQQERLTSPPLAGWDPASRVTVGDEPSGDRPWRGALRLLSVSTGGENLGLMAPGVLQAANDIVWKSRLQGLLRPFPTDPWPISALRILAFAVVAGVTLAHRPGKGTLIALVAMPFVLTFGKVFVMGRDPALADSLLSVVGVLLAEVQRRVRLRADLTATRS